MPVIPRPFSDRPVSDWIAQLQNSDVAEERVVALQAIGSLCQPNEVIRNSEKSLVDRDSCVRALAAKFIGNIKFDLSDSSINQLNKLLSDEDPDVRFEVSRTLIRNRIGEIDHAIQTLINFLDEPETQALMIAAIVNTLADAEPSRHVIERELRPRLPRFLDHDRAEVREAVASAYATWPEICTTSIPQLCLLLDDPEPTVREKIAFALGRCGIVSDEIRIALNSAINDEDTEVARIATIALTSQSQNH